MAFKNVNLKFYRYGYRWARGRGMSHREALNYMRGNSGHINMSAMPKKFKNGRYVYK